MLQTYMGRNKNDVTNYYTPVHIFKGHKIKKGYKLMVERVIIIF